MTWVFSDNVRMRRRVRSEGVGVSVHQAPASGWIHGFQYFKLVEVARGRKER